jgi:hypothetical protein
VLDVLVSPDTTIDRTWLQKKVEVFLEGFDWVHIRFIGGALTKLLSRLPVTGLFTVCALSRFNSCHCANCELLSVADYSSSLSAPLSFSQMLFFASTPPGLSSHLHT